MIRKATEKDIESLTGIFWTNIRNEPAYISHGEIQMGIADDVGKPAPEGRAKWAKYIAGKIGDPEAGVFICEEEGAIAGFTVVGIESDADRPFGVFYDIVIVPEFRKHGLGKALIEAGFRWFEEKGITDFYLESGIGNHNAHRFFERYGFKAVSQIFRKTV